MNTKKGVYGERGNSPVGGVHPKFRRRNFFIKKGLQSKFILGFTVSVLGGFLINLLLVYYLIDRELSQELFKIHLKIQTTSEIAGPVLWKLGAITVPCIIAAAYVIGYYLTKGVEEPLLAFEAAVKKTGKGDFTQKLPKKAPGELPVFFNKMTSSLEKTFTAVKDASSDIEKTCESLYTAVSVTRPFSRAQAEDALQKVSSARAGLHESLSKIKV
ncbi:MAG: methyl-accepting chemotaxis protein [Deltaproteobacteria bacterium]|nr:methyl-accepting chemotaxis protein [Deltaproteobacteria bacterium]